jgi:predicted DsbA family dithiol-disulfide isomerase
MTLLQRSDQGLAEVKQQDREAKKRLQISSVPYFIIEQKYALSGAQASTLATLN